MHAKVVCCPRFLSQRDRPTRDPEIILHPFPLSQLCSFPHSLILSLDRETTGGKNTIPPSTIETKAAFGACEDKAIHHLPRLKAYGYRLVDPRFSFSFVLFLNGPGDAERQAQKKLLMEKATLRTVMIVGVGGVA